MNKINFPLIILILIFVLVIFSVSGVFSVSPETSGQVYRIPVNGEIDPGMESFVQRGIEEAEIEGAEHIIFEISTYGGLVDSSINIKDLILATSVPTTTYISPRAFSGGALIALGGENLVMKQGSSLGAAETIPREEKFISALRTEFRSTAERRNRDGEIAAAMVDAEIEIPGIVEQGKILSFSALEAREHGIADQMVADFNQLLDFLELKEAEVVDITPSRLEQVARFLTRPGIGVLLLSLGLLALIFEAMVPGWGIGGTTGVLSLGLFFTGHMIHGYASWGVVVLLLVGLFLLGLEIFVIPGFGVTGAGGLIAMLASVYLVFPTSEIALTVIAGVLLLTVLGTIILIKVFGSSKLWRKISMDYSETVDHGYTASNNRSELVGAKGRALTPLRPAGIAEINDQREDVVTEGGMIDKGELVEVIKVQGSRIVVKKYVQQEDEK